MGDVAGVDDERRGCRHRVDLGDRLLERAERVRVGGFVEADMAVADLQKCEPARLRLCGRRLPEEAKRPRHTAAHRPEHAGPRPGHALQYSAAVDVCRTRQFLLLTIGHLALLTGVCVMPLQTGGPEVLFPGDSPN